ncbi:4-(cytidine 5'-diphospho)-2-C-methyl-D-erythritol kinase [Caloramator sp. E03]|uniref:4-(cytidine 5'-diphospho)-2-C-methyl-D-erythritol kinase n=1 Tax=Caloramator sp. E03 TaxID=2576307 RepID=UPI0011108076|nr:4-(cytidine 5'-diphospho)-2-C-methyl-D-erythritol kinase [Caloramator sp. E03]QCX33418.1 4-(cytidine 5'-diphospho)-2-C-methyl-D-erythritol kinase [Caloramator sp. E03]
MDEIKIVCPAKINLSLDVLGKREDGYHFVKMLMQSISLEDLITVRKSNNEIKIYCDTKDVPCNETNSAYKAAKLMFEKFNISGGVEILIDKKIPVAAGLAGGSTDAAGVIKAVNELYDLKLSLDEMMKIGVNIGADVPFCILGGTALAEGIGEILTPIKPLGGLWCVLAKPQFSVSTREVYSKLKIDEIPKHPDIERLIGYIEKGDYVNLAENMVNVLENVTIKEYPIIFEIKNIMMEFNALGSLMSGSGPTVFGMFESKNAAEKCYNRLRDYLKEVFLVKTCN